MRTDPRSRLSHPIRAGLPIAVGLGLLIAACAPGTYPGPDRRESVAVDTTVRTGDLSAFLGYYNGSGPEGRATGTRGFVRAALFASERMAAYGLQPVIQGEYTWFYATPLNFPRQATVRVFAPDTLSFVTSADVFPDGRSSSDSLGFESLIWDPTSETDVRGRVVAILQGESTEGRLTELVSRGARAVLIRGNPVNRPFVRPVEGLTAVQVKPDALSAVMSGIYPRPGQERRLRYPVELRVAVERVASASAINVLAMIPGAHPVLRNELVVVGARLDGYGMAGDVQLTDGEDMAVSASALLEAARILAERQRRLHPSPRTLLVALWSGSVQEGAGVKAFLDHPPWAGSAIQTFIDVRPPSVPDQDTEMRIRSKGYRYVPLLLEERSPSDVFVSRAEVFTASLRRDLTDQAANAARMIVERTIAEANRE